MSTLGACLRVVAVIFAVGWAGTAIPAGEQASSGAAPAPRVISSTEYVRLHRAIAYGSATLAEVRRALTQRDAGALSNTMHALYTMRWHRGVLHLLNDAWRLKKDKYPELAWDLLAKAPVRIALASTINRILVVGTGEYRDYIRSHGNDAHEFNRAQVAVALGFNSDSADVPLLREMADGDVPYVVQTAATGLALMNNREAEMALLELELKYRAKPRGGLFADLLRHVYRRTPEPGIPVAGEEANPQRTSLP